MLSRRMQILPVLLLVALLMIGCAQALLAQVGPEDIMVKRTQQLYDNGKFADAVTLCGQFFTTYPNSKVKDQEMLLLAEAYSGLKDYDKAAGTIDQLRKTFANSTCVPEALKLLLNNQLAQDNAAAAAQTFTSIYTLYPRQEAVWEGFQPYYQYLWKKNPEDAQQKLEALRQLKVMPIAENVRFYHLRLGCLLPDKPEQFLQEVIPALAEAKRPDIVSMELWYLAEMAQWAYPLLFKAGRFADAQTVYLEIDDMYAKQTMQFAGWRVIALTNYLNALHDADPTKYWPPALAVLETMKTANSRETIRYPMLALGNLYAPMVADGHLDTAAKWHDQLQKQLAAIHIADWSRDDKVVLMKAVLDTLRQSADASPKAGSTYVNAVLEFANFTPAGGRLPAEWHTLADYTPKAYELLAQAGRFEEAQALFSQLQAHLDVPQQMGQLNDYLQGRWGYLARQKPEQFMDEVLGYTAKYLKPGLTPDELAVILLHTRYCYGFLAKASRFDELLLLHQRVRQVVEKLDPAKSTLAADDAREYVNALRPSNEQAFLARSVAPEVQAKLKQMTLAAWKEEPLAAMEQAIILASNGARPGTALLDTDWLAGFAWLAVKLAKDAPQRPEAFRVLGAFAQQRVMCLTAQGAKSDAESRLAEQADMVVLTDYPAQGAAAAALANLALLYQSSQRQTELDALLARLTAQQVNVGVLGWAADYYFSHTPPDTAKALPLYERALATAPADYAQRPTWVYRHARCLELLGKKTEAQAAYQSLVETAKTTPLAFAATVRLAQLKGEAR